MKLEATPYSNPLPHKEYSKFMLMYFQKPSPKMKGLHSVTSTYHGGVVKTCLPNFVLLIHSNQFSLHKKGDLVFDYILCCYHPTLLNTNFQFLDNKC